jgi:hypothetical protein
MRARPTAPVQPRYADNRQIVVTATPFGHKLDETPAIAAKVDADQILRSGGASIADALKDVPGISAPALPRALPLDHPRHGCHPRAPAGGRHQGSDVSTSALITVFRLIRFRPAASRWCGRGHLALWQPGDRRGGECHQQPRTHQTARHAEFQARSTAHADLRAQ